MSKLPLGTLLLLLLLLLLLNASIAQRDEADAGNSEENQNAEQFGEQEIEELIRSLEQRINAKDAYEEKGVERESVFQVNPNPRDRKFLYLSADAKDAEVDGEDRGKRKIADKAAGVDELRKEAYGIRNERTPNLDSGAAQKNELSEFEKDEQYYRALLRLQNLYRLYNKRYLDDEVQVTEDRPIRHCGDIFGKKIDLIQSSKLRYLERSRILADRIAETAMQLVRRKARLLDGILHPGCGCAGRTTVVETVLPEPVVVAQPVVVAEVAKRRDVDIAAATSSATSLDASVNAGGVSVDAAVDTNVATAASVGTGIGGSGASISTSSGVSSGLHVGAGLAGGGLGAGLSSSLATESHSHLNIGTGRGMAAYLSQLGTCEDYERKMIMDMAIEESAGMIRKLALETRGDLAYQDPDFERRVLGLAIDLVNKVTVGVTGDVGGKLDLLGGFRYNSVDDYLKSSIYESELEADLVSNSGFDYVNHNIDALEDYVGHASPYSRGRCDSCSKYDMRMGNMCPLCKRSERVFHGRVKRRPELVDGKGKIYHLEQMPGVQTKRSKGVWEDVNKLYNFDYLENDKFIDLSMNCSENSTEPDCQRLHFDLVTPRDGEPVPLWFVRDYLSHGRDLALDMHDRARDLQQTGEGLKPAPHSPSMLHFLNNRVSNQLVKLNQESQLVLFGTKVLQQKLLTEYNITPNTFLEFLRHHGFRVTGGKVCRGREKRCNGSARYRSLEGSCNNFRNPSWGQSNTAFDRVLPARYSDGIHALALSVTGVPLPNPRALSAQLFSRRNATDSVFTLALVQWGQILAHDFARQVIDQTAEGGIECCDVNGSGPLPRSLQHHSCQPIFIPRNDSFYANYGQSCMNFVRSMTVAREDCSLGPANQLNGVSSFLDLSPVYGPDKATSDSLREFHGGRLRVELRGDRVMMPTSARSGYCDARTNWDICFETGDARTNQNPQLVVLQTLLVREHNRVAYELAALNPHWSDEKLFQESRRIVIAEYQHVTYSYWVPLVLGRRYSRDHGVIPFHDGMSNDYDARINPSTINSFTSGAFRFLHTLVEGSINLVADNFGTSSTLRLSNYYFRPQIVESNNNFEALLRGLVYQAMQKSDASFHEEVTEYLFRSDNHYGMDLEAIDIQRGRDHGIPGYNAYRDICRLGRSEDFHGLINEISLDNIEKLQSLYAHVDDIDLLVGATLETRVPGSLLGPTLQCLIGEQFYRSRVGDKYFYNNANFPHSFSPEQFEEIKKSSLASIICDLGDAVYEVQSDPFRISSYKNPTIQCFNLPKMNLEAWKEETEVYY
ncbi:uncharacterized protein LOC100119851 [Nasonia vitripennis]|uniref:Peroxidase n=1 Tax=Nasonia vitripennis TaxID=7425 RepID=A0A7M7G550_NASVI|nr:uncharacterized protein LOC100119851 [Nasonia vitripennis]